VNGDVWQLETLDEQFACDFMNWLYKQAISDGVGARNLVKKCYGDSWNTIKERMNTEGSIWYVWYMDGVHQLMRLA